ncbi:MAG TPA: hypothetical protein VLJ21_03040 [Candidatus Binatia bacterium]|nr:hypothetical protein [Candidatus Binatia bacterium]
MSEEKRLEPFVGSFQHLLDDKERLCLPADYIDALNERNRSDPRKVVYLMKGNGGDFRHVSIYDKAGFDLLRAKQPVDFSNVFDQRLDAQHRFTLPERLKSTLCLDKSIILGAAPNGSHVRIWRPMEYIEWNWTREQARTPPENPELSVLDRIDELVNANKPYVANSTPPDIPFVRGAVHDFSEKRRVVIPASQRQIIKDRNPSHADRVYVGGGQEFGVNYVTIHDVVGFDRARTRAPGLFNCAEYTRRDLDENRVVVPDDLAKQAQLNGEVAVIASPDSDYLQVWNARLRKLWDERVTRA